jgi:hypothetical protein
MIGSTIEMFAVFGLAQVSLLQSDYAWLDWSVTVLTEHAMLPGKPPIVLAGTG